MSPQQEFNTDVTKIPCLDNKLTIDIKIRKLLKQVFTY